MALAAASATILVGGVLAAGRAAAQEPEPTLAVEQRERPVGFLERLARLLGVEVETLQQAIKDVRLAAIDEAEAGGRINLERAAKARDRVNSGEEPRNTDRRVHQRHARLRAAIIDQAAAAIGVTADDLRASLRAGNSIADEAAARGVALDEVESAILDAARAKLERAVASGRIDQARADELIARLDARLDELLQRRRTAAPKTP
jgi:hypothetical protein